MVNNPECLKIIVEKSLIIAMFVQILSTNIYSVKIKIEIIFSSSIEGRLLLIPMLDSTSDTVLTKLIEFVFIKVMLQN